MTESLPNNYYTALLPYITIVIRCTIAVYPDIECKALYCYRNIGIKILDSNSFQLKERRLRAQRVDSWSFCGPFFKTGKLLALNFMLLYKPAKTVFIAGRCEGCQRIREITSRGLLTITSTYMPEDFLLVSPRPHSKCSGTRPVPAFCSHN